MLSKITTQIWKEVNPHLLQKKNWTKRAFLEMNQRIRLKKWLLIEWFIDILGLLSKDLLFLFVLKTKEKTAQSTGAVESADRISAEE